jgi:hypothetical protein
LLANVFARSLRNPFDQASLGVRVPDMYSFPTVTYHLHGEEILASSTGVGSVAFFPNPLNSLLDIQKDLNSTSSISSGSMQTFNPVMYAATTPNGLSAGMSTYRVASWGIKISTLLPELNATGRLVVATVPTLQNTPHPYTLGSLAAGGSYATPLMLGSTAQGYSTASLLNLPTAKEFTFADLARGDIEICGQYLDPAYFMFKSTSISNTVSSTIAVGEQATFVAGLETAVVNPESSQMGGGVAIIIYYEGVPINTSALVVEYIYHLEGTPVIPNSVNNNTPIAASVADSNAGSTAAVEAAVFAISGSKAWQWLDKGLQIGNNAVTAARRFATSPVGSQILKSVASFLM